ncbi:MAG: glycoside hydrolase family 31 protein, partial [Bacteroidales bacterium]|nr:glycoside hydrolase family 31 protein [Bacteroidales bacterium]
MKTLKHFLLSLILMLPVCLMAQKPTKASDKAVVKVGNDVRFTVLTDGIIRMEWDSTGQFTDDPSFVVVNRKLPTPKFKVKKDTEWLTITTEKMQLRYKIGSGKFTENNLIVNSEKSLDKADKPNNYFVEFEWKPGMKQRSNLMGTYRTLDGYDGDTFIWKGANDKMPMEDGLLAKDGWTLLDDSKSFLFDNSEWAWVKARTNPKAQDWYFMAYGKDYKTLIKDYTLIAGKVPMPPKFAFGYWWSRYWTYSDKELRGLVNNFKSFGVPLDVLVVDMDWHITNMPGWESNKGWTGWTWNKDIFPDPKRFLDWTESQNLKITLNLHPAVGMRPHEEQYNAFVKKLGEDPAANKDYPWVGSDKKYVKAFFDEVLHPMQNDGVDFWWLDWQQHLVDLKMEGLNNT